MAITKLVRGGRARRPGTRCAPACLVPAAVAAAVVSCYSPTDYDRRPSDVRLSLAPDTAPADGASTVLVKIAAPPRTQSGLSATLSVSAGSLVGASSGTLTLPLAAGDTVRARWQAPQSQGVGVLTAKIGTILFIQDTVKFVVAPPDTIELDPEKPSVSGTDGAEVGINVHLRRATGTPSQGIRVDVTPADTLGGSLGRILSTTPSDADGLVKARYAPGKTTYRGRVVITATVAVGGVTRTGSTWVTITD